MTWHQRMLRDYHRDELLQFIAEYQICPE